MKKIYQSPKIKIVAIHQTVHLLSNSDRSVAGGPTQEDFSINIVEGYNPDNITGGQNGASNRSRDIDWFDD